jgi:hypothetical protein
MQIVEETEFDRESHQTFEKSIENHRFVIQNLRTSGERVRVAQREGVRQSESETVKGRGSEIERK